MDLEKRMTKKVIRNIMGEPTNALDIEDAVHIAKEYAEEMLYQYLNIIMIGLSQHSLKGDIEMVKINLEQLERELKIALKLKLATEIK